MFNRKFVCYVVSAVCMFKLIRIIRILGVEIIISWEETYCSEFVILQFVAWDIYGDDDDALQTNLLDIM